MQQSMKRPTSWMRSPNRRRQMSTPKRIRSAKRPDQDEARFDDLSLDEAFSDSQEHELDEHEQSPREDEWARSAGTAASDDSLSADDTLGLYLQQMGAVPLLNRKEELDLAQRLERACRRYRHAALYNWS